MSVSPERERSILDAAARLFADRAPETVTMEEVARSAGVAKGTLYLYFPSKDEIVRTLLGSGREELAEGIARAAAAPGDAWTRLRRGLGFALRTQVEAADWYRMRRRQAAETGDLRRAFRRLVLRVGRPDAGADRDADLVHGALDATVRRCIEDGRAPDTAEEDALWGFVRRALGGRPLAGRTVLVTREEEPDGPLTSALTERGAHVVHVPLLETLPPEDPGPLRVEAARLGRYDWVLLTSARAADALAAAPCGNGGPTRFAVVGTGTARSARALGWEPEVVGKTGAEDAARQIARAMERAPDRGRRVLFPAADRARPDGVRTLEAAGAEVRVVTAYRTVPRAEAAAELAAAIAGGVDAVTFTSPSAVEAWAGARGHGPACADAAKGVPLAAAIGATTAAALAGPGFARTVAAARPGFAALADAVAAAYDGDGDA